MSFFVEFVIPCELVSFLLKCFYEAHGRSLLTKKLSKNKCFCIKKLIFGKSEYYLLVKPFETNALHNYQKVFVDVCLRSNTDVRQTIFVTLSQFRVGWFSKLSPGTTASSTFHSNDVLSTITSSYI